MREETRKRLDRALMMRKLRWVGVIAVVIALMSGVLYFENLDSSFVTQKVDGTVVYVGPLRGKFRAAVAESSLQVDVKLDDKRVAHLIAPRDETAPKVGDRIKIAVHVHGTGRQTFAWK
ncbi:MAG: hypothetical protein ACK5JT_19575 [Hyphomicrobiaceae bacterium]